jgi:hypothetical protein
MSPNRILFGRLLLRPRLGKDSRRAVPVSQPPHQAKRGERPGRRRKPSRNPVFQCSRRHPKALRDHGNAQSARLHLRPQFLRMRRRLDGSNGRIRRRTGHPARTTRHRIHTQSGQVSFEKIQHFQCRQVCKKQVNGSALKSLAQRCGMGGNPSLWYRTKARHRAGLQQFHHFPNSHGGYRSSGFVSGNRDPTIGWTRVGGSDVAAFLTDNCAAAKQFVFCVMQLHHAGLFGFIFKVKRAQECKEPLEVLEQCGCQVANVFVAAVPTWVSDMMRSDPRTEDWIGSLPDTDDIVRRHLRNRRH